MLWRTSHTSTNAPRFDEQSQLWRTIHTNERSTLWRMIHTLTNDPYFDERSTLRRTIHTLTNDPHFDKQSLFCDSFVEALFVSCDFLFVLYQQLIIPAYFIFTVSPLRRTISALTNDPHFNERSTLWRTIYTLTNDPHFDERSPLWRTIHTLTNDPHFDKQSLKPTRQDTRKYGNKYANRCRNRKTSKVFWTHRDKKYNEYHSVYPQVSHCILNSKLILVTKSPKK